MLDAMEQLDRVAKKVLYLQQGGYLLAALSDGDIRRWILSGGSLDAPVFKVANYTPKYLLSSNRADALKFLRKNLIESVPIVNHNMKIIDIIFWNDESCFRHSTTLSLPVVMMAGGKGTRLYPYTKILPKPLIPIGDIPIAERIMDRFNEFGCEQFYLVVNHKKNMIKAYFGEVTKNYSIEYADEDCPLGTGGGTRLLKNKIDRTFILTNCDVLIDADFSDIYQLHRKEKNVITMICSLKNYTVPYGVVEIGADGLIKKMQEKPQLSFFTNTGSYLVEPEVLEFIGDNENIGFPDVILRCQDHGLKAGVYPISEGAWLDMGQLDEMEKMESYLLKQRYKDE